MIKRSVVLAVIFGVLTGSLLFFFTKAVISKDKKPAVVAPSLKLYDTHNILLYSGTRDSAPKDSYKRAPYAVDLTLAKIKESFQQTDLPTEITTTIDLPLQNYIQSLLLENQEVWRQNGVNEVAVLVLDGTDHSLRAAVGSENYFESASSPATLISSQTINVIAKQACTTNPPDRQILILATNDQGIIIENNLVKATLIEKINEFEQSKGGELYGQN